MSYASETYPRLLDPEALNGPNSMLSLLLVRKVGTVARTLNAAAERTAHTDIEELPASVLIDARGNNQHGIEGVIVTAENMRAQDYGNRAPVRLAASMDFVKADPTSDQRSQLRDLGVAVFQQAAEPNHAEDINDAVVWMGQQDGLTVVMRAGNRFATDQALRAASFHIGESDAAGAYGPRVMDRNATLTGMVTLRGDSDYFEQFADVEVQPVDNENGFLDAAGAAFQTDLLLTAPLDTRYGRGGATRYWGALVREAGYEVVYDPAMAVHDSSGVSLDQLLEEATWHQPNTY